jgi:hypothetical protein
LTILRIAVILHLLAAATQAVLAGQFLSGADHSVAIHEQAGWGVAGICVVQILIVVIFRAPRGRMLPFLLSTVLILLGEFLQVGTGYGRFLNVHVPLGALILSGITAQLVWILR